MKKVLLLIITAIAITIALPQRTILNANVNLGQQWTGQTLYAPFDIPIKKSVQEIEIDRNLLAKNYIPIFRKDTTNQRFKYADSIMQRIYRVGIMPENEYGQLSGNKIRVASGNRIEIVPIEEIFTPQKAEELLQKRGYFVQITPNLSYDEKLNSIARGDELRNLSTTKGVVRQREVIVSNGQVIDEQVALVLDSYYNAYQMEVGTSTWIWATLGRFLIISAILAINLIFFIQFAQPYFGNSIKPLVFTFLIYIFMAMMVAITVRFDSLNPLLVPLPIVAIYLITFFNMRVAIFGNISVALLCALFVKEPFSFFLINFIAGMVAIFMMRHMYHRSYLFKAVGVIFLIELIIGICQQMVSGDGFKIESTYMALYLLINNFLLLGFYQIIYLIEHTFGFVSDLTLLELSDTNQRLLKNLAQQAPGTFQHSVQVANLAESAAREIGARPLLTRCGALYHDVGKMNNPFYFTENQTGVFNPHNDIDPLQSAAIIKAHVSDGVEIAHKERIPQQIVDFIEQHHANSIIYYFFKKAQQTDPNVGPNLYRYPGVCPSSKEVSICMMADAVEAASRSLPSYDKEPLEQLVDTIIDNQVANGLLINSDLTFDEVGRIKVLFKQKLNNIYHGRIAYPTPQ